MANRTEGDLFVTGTIRAGGSIILTDESVTEAKLDPEFRFEHRRHYFKAGTAATETVCVHQVRGATGEVVAVEAGSLAIAVGAATVVIDVQKSTGGGAFATVLSATITLDNTNTVRVPEAGTLVTSGVEDLVEGDLIQIVITATAGGGTIPTGLWVMVAVKEDAP